MRFLISNLKIHIEGLKKSIEDKGNNPQGSKRQRIVTFNMSMALVVFGLVVVGASLLSDMLGAYHAACKLGGNYIRLLLAKCRNSQC